MTDKKELIEKYYAEHPEWEQRRFSIIKQLAGAQLLAIRTEGKTGSISYNQTKTLIKSADEIICAINKDLRNIISGD